MSWFSHLVHSVENVGHDIAQGVKHLAHDVEHGLQKVGHEVAHGIQQLGHTISQGVHAVGHAVSRAITWIGHQVGRGLTVLINGVLRAVGELVGIHMRALTHDEAEIVKRVFKGRVPTDRILITSLGGLGNSVFTIPGSLIFGLGSVIGLLIPPLLPLLGVLALVNYLRDSYLINAGVKGFRDGLHMLDSGPTEAEINYSDTTKKGATLVHECTHVWQGITGAFTWYYVVNSVYHKIGHLHDNHQYDFTPGRNFGDYNVEQQGMIMEEWYVNGEKEDDPLFPYIRDNIWPGRPNARTNLNVPVKRMSRRYSALHAHAH
jgi:hypothetical protein